MLLVVALDAFVTYVGDWKVTGAPEEGYLVKRGIAIRSAVQSGPARRSWLFLRRACARKNDFESRSSLNDVKRGKIALEPNCQVKPRAHVRLVQDTRHPVPRFYDSRLVLSGG